MRSLLVFLIFLNSLKASSQLPSYAPTTNLLAWYSFSGNVLDNSGNGHNNADYNISLTTDRFNSIMKALYFSGTGAQYLNYGDVDDFEGWIQQSFSFWVLPETHGNSAMSQQVPILSKWSAPGDLQNSSYNVLMDGSDLCFVLCDGVSTDTTKASLSSLPLNQWSHVVITTNYGFVKIYINNVLVIDTVTTVSQISNSTGEFRVGDWYNAVNNGYAAFQGKIDDLGIWNRELDVCEVDALFSGNICSISGLNESSTDEKVLLRVTDLTGRDCPEAHNTILIHHFSDGSTEKVFKIE